MLAGPLAQGGAHLVEKRQLLRLALAGQIQGLEVLFAVAQLLFRLTPLGYFAIQRLIALGRAWARSRARLRADWRPCAEMPK